MSEPKKLYRDQEHAAILGVAAGFANYANMDITLMRLIFIAGILFSGIVPGVIFYFIAAIVMPVKEVGK